MDVRKKHESSMAGDQFPKDIIYKIFSKLPIKSLARFQCVSKLWLEYINDSYLETIRVKEPMPMMLEQSPSVLPWSKNKECKISFLNETQGAPVLEFRYKGPSYGVEENLVLGSCNGLILVCYERDPCHGNFQLAVVNPLRKECHTLPPISIKVNNRFMYWWNSHDGAAGIGFDDSTNTLKSVFVFLKEGVLSQDINALWKQQVCAMVHYSGSSSWREIAQIPAYPITGEGVFGHGRLHWLLISGFDWPSDVGNKIVYFDVTTEKFGLTNPPKPKGGHYQLVDLNGEVGFTYVDTFIEVWILKQEEDWVLHCRFPSPNDNVVISGCWNKDGDILLLTSYGGRRGLFIYTLKTGDLQQWHENWRCEADIRMYTSTLFSIQHKSLFNN